MKKIPLLFKRSETNLRYAVPVVNPECQWVIDGEGKATIKYDGTCVMKDENARWWGRREVKGYKGWKYPPNYHEICLDEKTGKSFGWEPIYQTPYVVPWAEAVWDNYCYFEIGTYELCGPKINSNRHKLDKPHLFSHKYAGELIDSPRDFDGLQKYLLTDFPYEGIVWHHPDGRMAKLKRENFME